MSDQHSHFGEERWSMGGHLPQHRMFSSSVPALEQQGLLLMPYYVQETTYLVYPRVHKAVCDTIRADVGPTLKGLLLGSAVSVAYHSDGPCYVLRRLFA